MERNVDLSSALKENDYSDPRKADLFVSISTVDAATPFAFAFPLQNCTVPFVFPRWSELLWHT